MKLWVLFAVSAVLMGAEPNSLRGKLVENGGKPAIVTADHKTIHLDASDQPVEGVLRDPRLAGLDFEVMGHYAAPDHFLVDPIHKRPVFVYKGGKRLYVTYWCEVCSIRTYTPGKCWCCQQETHVDLRETEQ